MSHSVDDEYPMMDQRELISLVVMFIEQNNLKAVKSYVPRQVDVNSRSINRGILLKDIARYMNRKEILNYLEAVEKQQAQERVNRFTVCFNNIDKIYAALKVDDTKTLLNLLKNLDNVFCNDSKEQNLALLKDFISKSHGKSRIYLESMQITWLKKAGKYFGY